MHWPKKKSYAQPAANDDKKSASVSKGTQNQCVLMSLPKNPCYSRPSSSVGVPGVKILFLREIEGRLCQVN